MEFKIGDRVRIIDNAEEYFGLVGKIESKIMDFMGAIYYKVDIGEEFPYAFGGSQLEICVEKEDAKHKISNELRLENLEQRIEKLEKEVLKPAVENNRPKEIKSSLLTEDERVILRSIPKKYNWIVRDKDWDLYLFEERPFQNEKDSNYWYSNKVCDGEYFGLFFNSMFMGLERDILYNIEELLKGECGNEKND